MISFGDVNFAAIVIAAALKIALGSLWYSRFLFGKKWARFMKLSDAGLEELRRKAGPSFVVSAVMTLTSALALERIATLFTLRGLQGALELAFWVWLGFIAATEIATVINENRDRNLYLLHIAYEYLALVLMACVIVFWK